MEKPSGKPAEARWLEPHDAALLLESARTYRPGTDAHAGPIYPLLAALLLTGGRTSEVLGLEVDDVSFQRRTITFRPNDWRRLKTLTSHRSVRLWPQAEAILRVYFADKEREGGVGRLLFPSPVSRSESLITDFRKALDSVAMRAGWNKGEIRSKMFRHTYCSARLQTLDGGAPVSPFTVGKELGHGGTSMVEKVYSHLGHVRHRAESVEFRLEHHREALGERLTALGMATN
jgi:integrase